MAKKYISNKLNKSVLFLSIAFLLAACANGQDHISNQKWLDAEKSAERTTVVLNNEAGILPIKNLEQAKIASIDFGFSHSAVFDSLLNKYQQADRFNGNMYLAKGSFDALLDDVKLYNTLVIQVSDASVADGRVLAFIQDAEKKFNVIIALFGKGQALAQLESIRSPLIWCGQHTPQSASFVAQLIFGGTSTSNVLNQNFSAKFKKGLGFSTAKTRLKYTVPEEVGLNTADLQKIDAIAAEAIREKATPSAVVMVIKDGNVIYNKAYGSPTYANARPTRITDIYDLASVTKISATTQVVMKLVEDNKLNLDNPLQSYLARARNTDKQDVKVREVMLHQAGFTPYIPFYQKLTPEDYRR